MLLSDPQDTARRFARRSGQPETAAHQDARALLERSGSLDALPEMYDRLLQVLASRPGTRTVVTVDGRVEQAYNFDTWWPHQFHIGQAEVAQVILEPRESGRWYERGVDGSSTPWDWRDVSRGAG